MKTNRDWRIESGGATARSVLECGDLSPLSPLADLSASEGTSSARTSAENERAFQFDGDKSPAKSGDKSPHSKRVASTCWAAVAVVLCPSVCVARAQNYSIDWFTIDGGGGTSTSGVV